MAAKTLISDGFKTMYKHYTTVMILSPMKLVLMV